MSEAEAVLMLFIRVSSIDIETLNVYETRIT